MTRVGLEKSKIVNGYEITVEPLLFGDFHIAVYKDKQLVLDHKYFVNDLAAAQIVFNKLVIKYALEFTTK